MCTAQHIYEWGVDMHTTWALFVSVCVYVCMHMPIDLVLIYINRFHAYTVCRETVQLSLRENHMS